MQAGGQSRRKRMWLLARLPVRKMLGQKAGVDIASGKGRMVHELNEKRQVGREAQNCRLTQSPSHASAGLFAVRPPGRNFGNHGIVVYRHLGLRLDSGIDPYPRPLGRIPGQDMSGRWQESVGGIFRVQTALKGVTVAADVILLEAQRFPGGNPDLFSYQIQTGNPLGNRMLNLEASVDFQKIEFPIVVEDELHGSGIVITGGSGHGQRGPGHLLPQGLGHGWRGSLFDYFLIAALNGAFPFAKMDDIPGSVTKNLDFHMTGTFEKTLDIHRAFGKGRFGFALRRRQGLDQLGFLAHNAHSFPATTRGRFNQEGVAEGCDLLTHGLGVGRRVFKRGNHRNAELSHCPAGDNLVANRRQGIRSRTDKGQAGLSHGPSKGRILR